MGSVSGGKEGIGAGVVHLLGYVHRRAKGVARRDDDADGKEGNVEDGDLGLGARTKATIDSHRREVDHLCKYIMRNLLGKI